MPLSNTEMDAAIRSLFEETFSMQSEDAATPDLKADTVLLETGLDSLGFAILVTRLEEELGFDPFSLETEAYYPVTYGDFLKFYMSHQPG